MSVDCCTESANLLNDGLSFENLFDHRMFWCYGIYWINLLYSNTDFCDDEYIDNLILECLRFCCCATVSVSLAWSKREWRRLLFVMVRFNCCRKCLYSMWMYVEKEFAILKTLWSVPLYSVSSLRMHFQFIWWCVFRTNAVIVVWLSELVLWLLRRAQSCVGWLMLPKFCSSAFECKTIKKKHGKRIKYKMHEKTQ